MGNQARRNGENAESESGKRAPEKPLQGEAVKKGTEEAEAE